MTKMILIFIIAIICGCSSTPKEQDDLPTIDFDPISIMSSPSAQNGKVTFRYLSAGTEFFIVINNGMKQFLILDSLTISGSKCAYSSRQNITVAPVSVATFKLPTIGLLGLCYNNTDQLIFIENDFVNVSEKGTEPNVSMFSHVRYHLPGKPSETKFDKYEKLYMNFAKPGSSDASDAIKTN
ncbi:hypothetical protein [Yersinia intermedia]|uniref:hypothetical protein n=1 Tax=Yersinia intermedia TaxID=631 RepID=UPI00065DB96D|nr:hypothetical protein [Yersinia intermedia]CRY84294.1 Uncharacterised protein [Yersinia intermedia]